MEMIVNTYVDLMAQAKSLEKLTYKMVHELLILLTEKNKQIKDLTLQLNEIDHTPILIENSSNNTTMQLNIRILELYPQLLVILCFLQAWKTASKKLDLPSGLAYIDSTTGDTMVVHSLVSTLAWKICAYYYDSPELPNNISIESVQNKKEFIEKTCYAPTACLNTVRVIRFPGKTFDELMCTVIWGKSEYQDKISSIISDLHNVTRRYIPEGIDVNKWDMSMRRGVFFRESKKRKIIDDSSS
jgi:predicted small integral membrane protein